MGTKELVEMARSLAAQIDPMLIGGRDAELLNGLSDAIERLERERDEARAAARMYEATAKEAAKGLECLSGIDEAWDAFGTRGNRKVLTLAEQISSLDRELDAAESENATLRARVADLKKALEWAGLRPEDFKA